MLVAGMDLEYWAATDVGRKRTHNEDNFLIDSQLQLFVVADGLGGHAFGEIASAMAVHTVRDVVRREHGLLEAADEPEYASESEICVLLEYAVHVASERIFDRAKREPDKQGMGTTLIAMLVHRDRGYIAHVGDSRIYLVRAGIVYQITQDHCLANDRARRPTLTLVHDAAQKASAPAGPAATEAYTMTRAVGPTRLVEVETLDFDIKSGDAFLLCTDGLYEYLEHQDIERALAGPEVRDVPTQLIEWANVRGGNDNITALVLRAGELVQRDAIASRASETLAALRKVDIFKPLTPGQLLRVLDIGRYIEVGAGQALFRENEPADAFHVLLEGEVEVSKRGVLLARLGPGHHFGEMGLIDDQPRSADASCVTPTRIFAMLRRDFHDILRQDPDLAVKLLWGLLTVLNSRLRKTTASLTSGASEQATDGDNCASNE